MTRSYSPRTFLRQAPRPLLRQLCEQQHLFDNFPWNGSGEHDVGPLYEAWLALPDGQREQVEGVFRDIDALASEEGVKALIEEGRFADLDLAAALGGLDGFHHKTLWAYLHHRPQFEDALRFVHADALPGRFWKKRKGLPRKAPDLSPAMQEQLQQTLSHYYRENQGRGHHCTVENYLRAGRQHYVFVFLDDYVDTYIGHAEGGCLVRRPQRPAFEVIFVYDPTDGTLDLYSQGDKHLRNDLMRIFCRVVLGEELPPEVPGRPPYDLNGLKSRDFAFATEPADAIVDVVVRRLRLSLLGSKRRITLEGDPDNGPRDVYEMMTRHLAGKDLTPALYSITQVTFQFRFQHTGHGRQRSMTFDVSFPDSCNLKSLREEYRLIGEKYLRRWGIDRA